MLHGRAEERQLLAAFVERIRDGSSTALVLVGEAGVGKTRLLDSVADADGVRIARTCGAESETHLGYAGLHRLLRPHLDRLDRLPAPQRSALSTAFGLVTGSPPDLFLVGLAALTLLADVAADAPLICLVDDAQWLDPESLAALAFVGRRLNADGIGLLVGAREDLAALRGLETHTMAGLSLDAARELVASAVRGRLDPEVADRIVAETGGNPLALIEVTAALSAEQLAGGAGLPDHLPIGRRLEAHFVGRVLGLPADTRLLLLLVAAAPIDDQALLWRAASGLGLPPTALDAADSAGIVTPGHAAGAVTPGHSIRHPLIRSAVYGAAPPADRRAVHAALGAAIDPVRDPDRRAWHLAESVVGLDDTIADELEQASETARGRGGYAAQAVFLSRSAELTSDVERRSSRFLAAIRPYLIVADIAAASHRLDQAAPGLTQPALAVSAQRARAAIEWYSTSVPSHVPATLLDALASFGPLDDETTRAMLWEAMTAGLLSGKYTAGVTVLDIARAAKNAPPARPVARAMADLLMDAYAVRIADGYASAVPLLRAAIATMSSTDLADSADPLASVGTWAAQDLWDEQGLGVVLARMDALDRRQGALLSLYAVLTTMAAWKTLTGRLSEAEADHDEAVEIGRATGMPPTLDVARVELLAWQGHEEATRAAVESNVQVWGGQFGYGSRETHALYALVILELSLGRYPEALVAAKRLFAEDVIGEGNRVLADAVEAAVRADDRPFAERVLGRLAERASASGTPWALGSLARARALLSDDAEGAFKEAVDQLSRTSVRTDLARTHLLYGEWLRRHGRRTDARDQLRTAHGMFADMGATAFAGRAELELRATGESLRRRSARPDVGLTPQELQVARLAIDGATNAEIATRLFVTASTVEYHLNKVFRKLGITSRRQLAGVLR
ncbi:helix-turn-helix transcriptional regulator [Cryptosporangium phraense]|uniref:AAA family ATPase n=1 Tax=Cryptosporangium phraense TaxID=2593070 RepID=A0A545AEC9_9ACTN|nr:helix-turn-helix transcriptional regulator [Cryptosporangium phraense]TQS39696.1 AAA family ATPase [Cryptosporangium phraense]